MGWLVTALRLGAIALAAQEKVEQWPGIRRPPNVIGRDIEVATASREPWVDANSYLVAYLRAVHPERPALLDYGLKRMPPRDAGAGAGRDRDGRRQGGTIHSNTLGLV